MASIMNLSLGIFVFTSHICIGKSSESKSTLDPKVIFGPKGPYTTVDPLVDPGDHYDPNYGFEPYWPGGEWKIRDPWEWDKSNATTTPIPTICGDECNYIFARFTHQYLSLGEVCAHRMRSLGWEHCSEERCGKHEGMFDLTDFYTFKSYCAYLDAQCKSKKNEIWGLVHLGPCIKKIKEIYKPNFLSVYSVDRMKSYLSTLKTRMDAINHDVKIFD